MLLRGINGNRHLADASNIQQNSNNDFLQPLVFSKIVEEQIETSLEHFAHEDATVLAEAYHNRAGNERSLLFFAHCLTRASSFESAYHLLKTVGNPTLGANGLKTAKSRYLFAYCAFALNRLQEAENTLRDTHITDQVQLHPSFKDTPSLPYAHSLLARILSETNRVESAQHHWTQSIQHDPMLWTSLRSYCDVGGQQIHEVLQSSLDELAQWQSNNNEKSKKEAGAKVISKGKEDEDGRRARTPSKNRSSRRNVAETTAPLHPSRTQANTEKRRTRLRNNGADARYNPTSPVLPNRITSSMALRASENSPLTRSNKLGANNGPMLIEQQMQMMQQEDKEEQSLMEMSNKRTTRRATALAAAAKAEAANKDNYIESTMQKSISQEIYQDRQIYYGLMEWILKLAEVQEKLSQFKCANALELLNTLSPQLSQLPLSLELRARVFFENGEYKRSCEIFEEIRRLYPRRLQSMEIYSTALWQLNDSKKLSALASEMAEIGRNQPETWCIAGNCFSLEKQHETSIECLERAIRLDHRFGYAYSLLGHELIDMNDLGRAEQAFRKAVVYAPNDYRAWYGLGLVNFKEEKLNLARVNIQRSVQINPTNTVLLCQLAVIEQALHHNETAMQCLERALKHQPNNVPCRFHRARLLFDTGHYEQAKMELEELKVLSPDEAHVFFLLGRVNRKLGDTHMALLNFSWATEIDPRGEQNQSALTTDNGPYDDEPID